MIDDQELRAIQFLAERVRKATPGAATWDSAGLFANLRKLRTRNLHMTIEHVLRHAADPAARTPGVLAGSFTPPAPNGVEPYRPPKRADECPRHVGQWAGNCATCKTEAIPAYSDPAPGPRVADPIKAARDAAVAAKYVPTDEESADV